LTDPSEIWGRADVEGGGEIERVFGALTLRIRRTESEVWVYGTHDVDGTQGSESWTRWSVPAEDELQLQPSLPDRPVVVSPEQPFYLPEAGRARVFVRIPLFVELCRTDASGASYALTRLPSVVLSDTWWGSFTEGELAYWLTTRARRSAPRDIFEPHLAVCSLLLENEGLDVLEVDRFAVRVAHLSLFGDRGGLWTDEVEVRYEGAAQGSHIRYSGRPPDEARGLPRIAEPQVPPPRGLHARTFGRLLTLTGL